ncbi:hypothetical protein [Cellulomonas terrae]|uniref:Uncharacterized protein n=1 Tax=Cellulomonas terrae TaxID=311234 RepID=A0A511JLV5_9CELL|nr:hypothetical protein [Cellulomonas terrae]GEL99000.1 hypothetical protein CTE05_25470 [Cellulomonas terrae]
MEILKTRTARGRGRWGHDTYDVELISCTQSWWDAAGSARTSITGFQLVCSAPANARYFSTEADRDAFIAASFSDLSLDRVEPPEVWSEAQSLHDVLGVPLTGIETVEDYLWLTWPDDRLAIYSEVDVIEAGQRWRGGDAGFMVKLQSLVGQRVTAVDEILDRGLVLRFESSMELEVNLREAADGVAEAADHSSMDGWSRGSLWMVGEPPFDT